jgi:stage III sporulation protein SpoIIIAA
VSWLLLCSSQHLPLTPACSNDIAGDRAVPHPCIGSSRRVMVPRRELQHELLLGAVQNLSPDVVICDEISDHKVCAR